MFTVASRPPKRYGVEPMLMGVATADVVIAAVASLLGGVATLVAAVATGVVKIKKATTDDKIVTSQTDIQEKVVTAEVELREKGSTFNEMKLLLRGMTVRLTKQDGMIDELREENRKLAADYREELRKADEETRSDLEAANAKIAICEHERAVLTERVKWLEDRASYRTKSDEIRKPDNTP